MKVIRVLLIDDDKIQLSLTAAMLKQQGIDAVCCEQLEQLIEQLRSSVFDVLLTDIQMPAINGFAGCLHKPFTVKELLLRKRHALLFILLLKKQARMSDGCNKR